MENATTISDLISTMSTEFGKMVTDAMGGIGTMLPVLIPLLAALIVIGIIIRIVKRIGGRPV